MIFPYIILINPLLVLTDDVIKGFQIDLINDRVEFLFSLKNLYKYWFNHKNNGFLEALQQYIQVLEHQPHTCVLDQDQL